MQESIHRDRKNVFSTQAATFIFVVYRVFIFISGGTTYLRENQKLRAGAFPLWSVTLVKIGRIFWGLELGLKCVSQGFAQIA